MRALVECAPQVERAVDHKVCGLHRLNGLVLAHPQPPEFMLPAGGRVAKCREAFRKGALWPMAASETARTLGP